MSIESVKSEFQSRGLPLEVIEMDTSPATVSLAARALGGEPARIAKTMALRLKEEDILILSKGDARLDNRKFKDLFSQKARMIPLDEVEAATGHPVGGVCPFGLKTPLKVFLDESLKIFDVVYPAGGGPNTAVKITVEDLAAVTGGRWVDLCQV